MRSNKFYAKIYNLKHFKNALNTFFNSLKENLAHSVKVHSVKKENKWNAFLVSANI